MIRAVLWLNLQPPANLSDQRSDSRVEVDDILGVLNPLLVVRPLEESVADVRVANRAANYRVQEFANIGTGEDEAPAILSVTARQGKRMRLVDRRMAHDATSALAIFS
jgi:hypothetical protein